jgi:outer membrane assembly lipoprotein YfiO
VEGSRYEIPITQLRRGRRSRRIARGRTRHVCFCGSRATANRAHVERAKRRHASPTPRRDALAPRCHAPLAQQRGRRFERRGGTTAEKTKDDAAKTISSSEEARTRLRGLEREVGSVISDVSDLRGKQDRSERFEMSELDKLETAVEDLNRRVEDVLRNTADARRATNSSNAVASNTKKKKGGGLLGKLNPFGGGGDDKDKYAELTGTVAPGRDRELFELAAKRTRKGNYEEGRLLFNVITTTYTESPFLPLSKLAVADSFYLEGTTSALIQANASYREWLTFFPTHPLADDVMLKMAEAEMRQMGLADRDTSHARKAEQQLKVVLQQFPDTPLRADVQLRMNEVQENLAMHNLQVANFYLAKYAQEKPRIRAAVNRACAKSSRNIRTFRTSMKCSITSASLMCKRKNPTKPRNTFSV